VAHALWVDTGRVSAVARRQPSAAIYERIYTVRPRPTEAEPRRAKEALVVRMRREAADF
jgi:hypothetical protein